ncbi:hypothetical protein ES702_02112 [subsurface metagenome]
MAFFVYLPCLRWTCLIFSIPSGVLGPVLFPPCSLHLPFFIAGAWHGAPFRVLAPHRGAFIKSPGGLSFLSHPLRFSWGLALSFIFIPSPRLPAFYMPYYCFPSAVDVDVFYCYFLFHHLTSVFIKSFYLF